MDGIVFFNNSHIVFYAPLYDNSYVCDNFDTCAGIECKIQSFGSGIFTHPSASGYIRKGRPRLLQKKYVKNVKELCS